MATFMSFILFKKTATGRTPAGSLFMCGPLPVNANTCVWAFKNLQGALTVQAASGRAFNTPEGLKLCNCVPSMAIFAGGPVAFDQLLQGNVESWPCTDPSQNPYELVPQGQPQLVPDAELAGLRNEGTNPEYRGEAPQQAPSNSRGGMQPIDDSIWRKLPGIGW